MNALSVLDDPTDAGVALDPLRARLLALLAQEPASAATLAGALDLPRQRVGYHLRLLADRGLVVEVGQRRHGGITERLFASSASTYAIAPGALGGAGAAPERIADHLSAAYLVALAGRAISEVGALLRGAAAVGKQLPSLSVDSVVRFATPADRAAFADELDAAIVDLVARYHDETAPDGRSYRLVTLVHPRPSEETP